jgi:hypothetical protein
METVKNIVEASANNDQNPSKVKIVTVICADNQKQSKKQSKRVILFFNSAHLCLSKKDETKSRNMAMTHIPMPVHAVKSPNPIATVKFDAMTTHNKIMRRFKKYVHANNRYEITTKIWLETYIALDQSPIF